MVLKSDKSNVTPIDPSPEGSEVAKQNVGIENLPFLVIEKDIWVSQTSAAAGINWPVFSVPTMTCFLLEARVRYDAVGGSGATLDIHKITDNEARGAGRSMLESVFALTETAKIAHVRGPTIILAAANIDPANGDAMEIVPAGTIDGLDDLVVTVLLGVLPQHVPVSKNI